MYVLWTGNISEILAGISYLQFQDKLPGNTAMGDIFLYLYFYKLIISLYTHTEIWPGYHW